MENPKLGTNGNPHPKLLAVKDRIKGHFYLDTKKKLSIWDGNIFKCEHDRRRSECKECGGGSICEHNRRKSECKECGGSAICEHNRVKRHCKECGGSGLCKSSWCETQRNKKYEGYCFAR